MLLSLFSVEKVLAVLLSEGVWSWKTKAGTLTRMGRELPGLHHGSAGRVQPLAAECRSGLSPLRTRSFDHMATVCWPLPGRQHVLGSPTSSAHRSSIMDMDGYTRGHPAALKEKEEGSKIKCGSLIVQLDEPVREFGGVCYCHPHANRKVITLQQTLDVHSLTWRAARSFYKWLSVTITAFCNQQPKQLRQSNDCFSVLKRSAHVILIGRCHLSENKEHKNPWKSFSSELVKQSVKFHTSSATTYTNS